MDSDKLKHSCTTDGQPARPGFEDRGAPAPIDPKTGQHEAYWVLCEEERKKGFVRPVRRTYRHVGRSICGKIEPRVGAGHIYAPKLGGSISICALKPGHDGECFDVIQSVTQPEAAEAERMHTLGGCGSNTSMGQTLAETYARDPKFYGATFCCQCGGHFPVGEEGEFVWIDDGSKVGT